MKKSNTVQSPLSPLVSDGIDNLASERPPTSTPTKSRGARKLKLQSMNSLASASNDLAGPSRIRIEYTNAAAREVFIAGSFNEWNPRTTALTARGEGNWGIDLQLGPGRYEYRFVVDGQWLEDPKSPEHTANPFGELNSVLQIRAQE